VVPFLETIPDEDSKIDTDGIYLKYVKPLLESMQDERVFVGCRFQYAELDFKVVAASPPSGILCESTIIYVDEPVPCLSTLEHATLVPITATVEGGEYKDIVEDVIQPYFHNEMRHLVQGEVLFIRGIQFKVANCSPVAGIVDETTTIYTESDNSLPDLERIHILPVYETLPNRDKDITEERILKDYVVPYFQGTFQSAELNDPIMINGVEFRVVAANPPKGVVTDDTLIFAYGAPITSDDLKEAQLRRDEEVARQLQMQMQREEFGMGFFAFNQQELAQANQILRLRLQTLLSQLPENHPHRGALIGMEQRLANDPSGFHMQQFLAAMRGGEGAAPNAMHAANQSQIDQLPTSIFESSTISENTNTELLTCRVCLSEYEDGDVLRTLPCFHRYHAECIDRWLVRDNKCPMCKHEIDT